MRHFDTLRTSPWEPKFEWVDTIKEAADLINKPHEDYPARVSTTVSAINYVDAITKAKSFVWPIFTTHRTNTLVHSLVFKDHGSQAGKWRRMNVVVGLFRPPDYDKVEKFMDELIQHYNDVDSIERLIEWYTDFETIHPYRDGNGRVGGILVAAYSHFLHPKKGYLAPKQ